MAAPIDVSNSSTLYLKFHAEGADPRDEYTKMVCLSDRIRATLEGFFSNETPDTPYLINYDYPLYGATILNMEKTWLDYNIAREATPEHPQGLITITAIKVIDADPPESLVVMLPNLATRLSTVLG